MIYNVLSSAVAELYSDDIINLTVFTETLLIVVAAAVDQLTVTGLMGVPAGAGAVAGILFMASMNILP